MGWSGHSSDIFPETNGTGQAEKEGSGFGVQRKEGSGFRVQGLGLRRGGI
jgi:hypothetical protein